jgi:hypothetical protein
MNRSLIAAAAVAAAMAFTAPAQAYMADPGLKTATPATLQLAQYRYHRDRDWRRHYAWRPRHHRHCWNVRVRTWGHHYTWVRRCAWR